MDAVKNNREVDDNIANFIKLLYQKDRKETKGGQPYWPPPALPTPDLAKGAARRSVVINGREDLLATASPSPHFSLPADRGRLVSLR
jgi:hypothetical protein